jgi:hypothetical protein
VMSEMWKGRIMHPVIADGHHVHEWYLDCVAHEAREIRSLIEQ